MVMQNMSSPVLILGGIFYLVSVFILRRKCFNSLGHILVICVFHSFSLVLVDEKSTFSPFFW